MIICICVLYGGSIFAFGQREAEVAPRTFIEELVVQLRERDWSEEDVHAVAEQARELSWEGTEHADAELIAYALTYELRHGVSLDTSVGLNRAQVALELALLSMEMEALGYSRQNIARTAVDGVRNVLEQVQNWKDRGRDAHLGELIRETVRDKAQQAASVREHAADKGKPVQQKPAGSQDPPGLTHNPGVPF